MSEKSKNIVRTIIAVIMLPVWAIGALFLGKTVIPMAMVLIFTALKNGLGLLGL